MNSSSISFAVQLQKYLLIPTGINISTQVLYGLFTVIPILLFATVAIYIIGKEYTPARMTWLLIAAFGPMMVLPSVNNDYKLVILSAPFLLMAIALLVRFQSGKSLLSMLQMLILIIIFLMIHRSYNYIPSFFLINKYCLILTFQTLVLWCVFTLPHHNTHQNQPFAEMD